MKTKKNQPRESREGEFWQMAAEKGTGDIRFVRAAGDFVRNLLSPQQKRLVEKIEGMRKKICDCHVNCKEKVGHTGDSFTWCECGDYNKTPDGVLELPDISPN